MNKGRSFLRKVFVFINIFAAAGLLLSYAAAYISPGRFWFLAFFGLSYPVWLLINTVFVLLWLVLFHKMFFVSLVCILLGWNNLLAIYPFRFSDPVAGTGARIRIISYNVHSLYGNQRDVIIPETKSRVTEFLSRQDADIVCIQEFFAIGEEYTRTLGKFSGSIKLDHYYFRNYQEFWNKTKINAIATFSRYPVVREDHFKLPDHSVYAIYTDILLNHDTIRVYNLHLESIRFGDDDYSFYSHLTEPDKEKTPISEGSRRMFGKLRKAFILRATEVDVLSRSIDECPYPVILAGDFNDTPSSYSYHQLTRKLTDSFREAGNGFFESTYAGKFPAFRIDYLLHSKHFTAGAYKKFNVDLSDHYPISATMVFHP